MTAPRVLIFGWHGSSERNLRAIARSWQAIEPALVCETFVPDTWRAMSRRDGWALIGSELAQRIESAHRADPRPLVIHAFSNAGFWTSLAVLDALAPPTHAALAAVMIDSAPGFPEQVSARFTSKYAAMAMMPSLLASLGRRPRPRHWLLTPPVRAFLWGWHHVAPDQVAQMETSQRRMIAHLRGAPLTLLYGDVDELVPHLYVEAFRDRAVAAGIDVTAERFAGSGHVRHFSGHRSRYIAVMRRALVALTARA